MKALRAFAPVLACFLALSVAILAQGPINRGAETVSRPKKGAEKSSEPAQKKEADLPPIPSEFKRDPNAPVEAGATFTVNAADVTVDVAVLDNNGHFIPNIPQEFFRIYEDNVPQKIASFSMGEAPMTVALVVEFSNLFQQYGSQAWYETLTAAYEFASRLRPDDYLAIVAYDLRPEILSDFSTNRQDTQMALQRMRMAGFSEANLFDAVQFTVERMADIEGRKAVVLISSGIDTFSKINYGEARKIVQNAGVPIYSVGIMQALRDMAYAYGNMSDSQRSTFLMADNQLRTLSKESGGMAFFPRFIGQFPEIFNSIQQALRSQYVLTYTPTNQARDGKFRKIKVEIIDPATNKPWRLTDAKGKNVKYEIVAKPGYQAPREVE